MRLPQRPPSPPSLERYHNLLKADADKAQDVVRFLSEIELRYLHWDEFRRRDMPAGLSASEVWTLLKLHRGPPRASPIRDVHGHTFGYRVPGILLPSLHQVDRLSGTELVTRPDFPLDAGMRDRVLINSLMEEAISTSRIEGAVTTIQRGKDLLRSGRRPSTRSEQMIANGYRTMNLIRERLDRPLEVGLIHELQSAITESTLNDPGGAGRFRTSDDVVVEDARDGDVVFTPPSAASVPREIGRLVAYANAPVTDGVDFVHPLIKASILHFWLAYLHPFADGNGRTARALFYWYMLKQGYILFQFLTVSRVIDQSRMQYYRSFLYSETDDNDLTYFIVYNVNAVQKAIANLHRQLEAIRAEQRQMSAIRRASGLNARQRAVLSRALRHPGQAFAFESHQASHGISYQTSRTDLLELVRRGFLKEIGGRPRTFMPAPDLATALRA